MNDTPAANAPRLRSAGFDSAWAVTQGQLVNAAYSMFSADESNLTPYPQGLPDGWGLVAWIVMQDFIVFNGERVFYGFIAENAGKHVIAIRGTSTWVEWWDDLTAIALVPFNDSDPGWGEVGYGFKQIYETLEVIPYVPIAGAAAGQSLKPLGGFARQVAAVTTRAASGSPPQGPAPTLAVTGHSLGSALATLYVADNARKGPQWLRPVVGSIYTFASPRVGDGTFAQAFDALDLTSWRIVNDWDVVPKVPLGYTHVDALRAYDPWGKVWVSPVCSHSLTNYLSLIDPGLAPSTDCAWPFEARALGAAKAVSVPAGPVTVNITVNVERGD